MEGIYLMMQELNALAAQLVHAIFLLQIYLFSSWLPLTSIYTG